jgi:CHASE3 domain sensor protein
LEETREKLQQTTNNNIINITKKIKKTSVENPEIKKTIDKYKDNKNFITTVNETEIKLSKFKPSEKEQ